MLVHQYIRHLNTQKLLIKDALMRIMNKEKTEYITELLSKVEHLINLYMEDGLEKNNALTKIAEAVFWVTYGEEENE